VLVRSNTASPPIVPFADQTVFHITGYQNRYFWGVVGTQLGTSWPTYSSMLGSVTPEGKVLLLFQEMESSSSPTITEGRGQMTVKFGRWTMANQVFISTDDTITSVGVGLGYWAYMVQTRSALPSWYSLPSSGVSVPQFLAGSRGPGPRPIGSLA
jgi:hypothetical protein